MNIKEIIWIFSGFILATHFYNLYKSQYRNKHGKCAKCNIEINDSNSICIAASYQKYYYCKSCGKSVKTKDKYIFGITIAIVIVLLGATYVFTL